VQRLPRGSVHFTWLGSGPELTATQRELERRNLQGSATLAGTVNDVSAYLEHASILLHPATMDHEPLAVLEALAHGVPVVASSVGAVPEILGRGGGGLTFEAFDSASMVEAVVAWLTDAAARERYAKEARSRYEDLYAPNRFKDALREVIQATLRA
jgi:Glycosyltransferase